MWGGNIIASLIKLKLNANSYYKAWEISGMKPVDDTLKYKEVRVFEMGRPGKTKTKTWRVIQQPVQGQRGRGGRKQRKPSRPRKWHKQRPHLGNTSQRACNLRNRLHGAWRTEKEPGGWGHTKQVMHAAHGQEAGGKEEGARMEWGQTPQDAAAGLTQLLWRMKGLCSGTTDRKKKKSKRATDLQPIFSSLILWEGGQTLGATGRQTHDLAPQEGWYWEGGHGAYEQWLTE